MYIYIYIESNPLLPLPINLRRYPFEISVMMHHKISLCTYMKFVKGKGKIVFMGDFYFTIYNSNK